MYMCTKMSTFPFYVGFAISPCICHNRSCGCEELVLQTASSFAEVRSRWRSSHKMFNRSTAADWGTRTVTGTSGGETGVMAASSGARYQAQSRRRLVWKYQGIWPIVSDVEAYFHTDNCTLKCLGEILANGILLVMESFTCRTRTSSPTSGGWRWCISTPWGWLLTRQDWQGGKLFSTIFNLYLK